MASVDEAPADDFVWIQVFMRWLILLVLVFGFVACGSGPTSPDANRPPQNWYVSTSGNDGGAGTMAAPWLTLRHALGQLRGGDTLYLREGTYTQRIFETDFGGSGSSWSAAITIAAQPGEHVVLRVVPGGDNAVRFQDGSVRYVVLDGLAIDGTGGGDDSTLVYFGPNSHHLRFQNVEITNSRTHGITAEGSFHEFINLNVHHNGLDAYGILKGNGVYMTASDSTIVGGDFYDNTCFGVRLFHSDPSQSSKNSSVKNARLYSNGYGIGVGRASLCTSGGGGMVVGDVNNIAQDNLAFDNLTGLVVFGFKPSSGNKLYANTVRNNLEFGIDIEPGAANTDVKDNMVYDNRLGIVDLGSGTILSNNGPQ